MDGEQHAPARRRDAALHALLERLSPRRQVVGLVVAVLGGGVLALPRTDEEPVAWLAMGLALALFGLEGTRPVAWLLDRAGGVVGAALVALLVEGTGGADSVFQDLYVLILVYAAVTLSWSRIAVDALGVLAAATVPAWGHPSPPGSGRTSPSTTRCGWGWACSLHW